jgi:hypothetical protein
MEDETNSICKKDTWKLVQLPPNKKAILRIRVFEPKVGFMDLIEKKLT